MGNRSSQCSTGESAVVVDAVPELDAQIVALVKAQKAFFCDGRHALGGLAMRADPEALHGDAPECCKVL
jgi:hypothetical protein